MEGVTMPDALQAQAYPRKHFFVEMFTRDISLIHCILDLVDNAVDGLIRSRDIDIGKSLLSPDIDSNVKLENLPMVSVDYTDRQFKIKDNCGGISLQQAKTEVFNFGHSSENHNETQYHQLGVYGVGLKRALFKIGRNFKMTSQTEDDGFETTVDLEEWIKHDSKLEDWTFPLSQIKQAKSALLAGTHITIKRLRDEVKTAMADPTFEGRLRKTIAHTYALFLGRYIQVKVNGRNIDPLPIPIGGSQEVEPSRSTFEEDGVHVLLIASVASRNANQQWTQDQAGWYIACNGRLVIIADKTVLTGWGTGALPAFHSKYRGFVGLALFQSNNPMKLPWRTTKSGLNQEARIYQIARNKMNMTARPITSFLDKMYPSEPKPENWARDVADKVTQVDVRQLAHKQPSTFKVTPDKKLARKTTVRVQFNAEKADVERVKKHLRRPDMGAGAVGKHTFNEYITNEGL